MPECFTAKILPDLNVGLNSCSNTESSSGGGDPSNIKACP